MITAKDQFKRAKLSRIRIPEIEGRVKIQLFDAKTRQLEKEIAGHNMATNAIRDIFLANYQGVTDYSLLMPIVKELLGGLLCFNQALTEDADRYYPPTNNVNPVKAHAGATTYTSTADDNTRGLPNGTESAEISGGYRFVWDFPATQGNGTISALSLTHKDTGDFWLFNGTKFKPFLPLRSSRYEFTGKTGFPPQFYDRTNRIAYQCSTSGTTLTIWEILDSGVIDDIGITQPILNTPRTAGLTQIQHTITLDQPANKYVYMFREADRQIHALYCSGSTISRTIINLQTWATSSGSLTVSGANMAPMGDQNAEPFNYNIATIYPDKNGYIYIRKSGNTAVYKIKYTNTSDVTEITAEPANVYYNAQNSYISTGNHAVNPWSGVIVSGNQAYTCAPGNLADNADFNALWNQVNPEPNFRADQVGDNQLVFISPKVRLYQAGSSTLSNIMSKLYLGSIFNLPEPVNKTSAQAMKITYEVTERQPEEDPEEADNDQG